MGSEGPAETGAKSDAKSCVASVLRSPKIALDRAKDLTQHMSYSHVVYTERQQLLQP